VAGGIKRAMAPRPEKEEDVCTVCADSLLLLPIARRGARERAAGGLNYSRTRCGCVRQRQVVNSTSAIHCAPCKAGKGGCCVAGCVVTLSAVAINYREGG
jgi:hypothetical protein